jgi:co-chaperonin GroES (HSP10)
MTMNMIGQRIAVKVSKKYNDEVEFSSGEKLFLDVTWNPEHHVTICGEVVALPRGEWCKNTRGDWIKQELQVGDLVYFNYLTVDTENLVTGERDVYLVDLEECFSFVRSGSLTAISNHVLVEPEVIEEKVGSIYVGVPKKSETEGYVRHIGAPLKNKDELGLISGDKVRFHERNSFLNKIEGVEYYVMKQDDLLGKIIGGTV